MSTVRPMRRRRRRRLNPRFVLFCLVMAALLVGLVFLLRSCGKRGDTEKRTRRTDAVQTVEETEGGIPEGYVPYTADMGYGALILVSNDHDYTFPAKTELVGSLESRSAGKYLVRDYSIRQEKEAFEAFDAMLCDFADATGITNVNITSAYRSAEEQEEIFNNSAAANGLEHAKRYVTHPGGSEHHTGLAVDLNVLNPDGTCYDFDGGGDYAWIYDHCAEYGIILRYGADKEMLTAIAPESWHFRYVGVPHAAYITENGLCLEEYIDLLHQYTMDQPLQYGGYTIYYCPQDALYVPADGGFTLSGNNVDGFIVTIG